jgi:hypothetical protein
MAASRSRHSNAVLSVVAKARGVGIAQAAWGSSPCPTVKPSQSQTCVSRCYAAGEPLFERPRTRRTVHLLRLKEPTAGQSIVGRPDAHTRVAGAGRTRLPPLRSAVGDPFICGFARDTLTAGDASGRV